MGKDTFAGGCFRVTDRHGGGHGRLEVNLLLLADIRSKDRKGDSDCNH
jgi:hypothetical protein